MNGERAKVELGITEHEARGLIRLLNRDMKEAESQLEKQHRQRQPDQELIFSIGQRLLERRATRGKVSRALQACQIANMGLDGFDELFVLADGRTTPASLLRPAEVVQVQEVITADGRSRAATQGDRDRLQRILVGG